MLDKTATQTKLHSLIPLFQDWVDLMGFPKAGYKLIHDEWEPLLEKMIKKMSDRTLQEMAAGKMKVAMNWYEEHMDEDQCKRMARFLDLVGVKENVVPQAIGDPTDFNKMDILVTIGDLVLKEPIRVFPSDEMLSKMIILFG